MRRTLVLAICCLLCAVQTACASPMRIRDDIDRGLDGLTGLGRHEIDVGVKGNSVTLDGFVSSYDDQERVLQLVRRTDGVKDIENNLRVDAPPVSAAAVAAAPGGSAVDAIRKRAQTELAGKNYNLDITQRGNTIVIGGSVRSPNDSRAVESIARQMAPTMAIDNKLVLLVPLTVPDSEVTQRVLSQLRAEGITDLSSISVETRDAVVHFSGAVKNHREIDRMLSIALMVDGVRSVRSSVKIG